MAHIQTAVGLVALTSIVCVVAFLVHDYRRRAKSPCTNCGSIKFVREHRMRRLYGLNFEIKSNRVCLKCGLVTEYMPIRWKKFNLLNYAWRVVFSWRQFVTNGEEQVWYSMSRPDQFRMVMTHFSRRHEPRLPMFRQCPEKGK